MTFNNYMHLALSEAKKAASRGEVPIGAVIVDQSGNVIAKDGNRTIELHDPTAHAEILVIRKACLLLKNQRLNKCNLYVTLEPCPMCAAAISNARISKLYFGSEDKKSGGVINGARIFSYSQCHHRPEIYEDIGSSESHDILKDFFKSKRT